jgi:hypothetical protein
MVALSRPRLICLDRREDYSIGKKGLNGGKYFPSASSSVSSTPQPTSNSLFHEARDLDIADGVDTLNPGFGVWELCR